MSTAPTYKNNYDIEGILNSLKGKRQGEYTVIVCPFHADSNPSCSVKARPPYQGFYKCWSCGAKGAFSKLAEKLGIEAGSEATPPIDTEPYEAFFNVHSTDVDDRIIDPATLKSMSAKNVTTLGIKDGWRGVPIDFLRETVGAKIVDSRSLYFPVMVNHKEVGYIRAQKEKPKSKKFPSYLNKPGLWSKTQGLFLFDQALEVANGSSTLILTEGPRDPMRLMQEGLPAVAMLGTQSWSDAKRRLIELAGIENLILCMDGDEAGHTASMMLKEACDGYLNIYDFELYKWEGEYDPFNMPKSLVRKLHQLYQSVAST
jgi:hypothetical protein